MTINDETSSGGIKAKSARFVPEGRAPSRPRPRDMHYSGGSQVRAYKTVSTERNPPKDNKHGQLILHLRGEDSRDRFTDFSAVDAVERQSELGLHQPIRDAGVVTLALHEHDVVLVGLLTEMLLGGGKLDFVFLAEVVLNQVFQRIKDARRENVLAEV